MGGPPDCSFPRTVDQFLAIRNIDKQMDVATLLAGDPKMQDRIFAKYNWVRKQVQPLLDLYSTNVSNTSQTLRQFADFFQAEFKAEVQSRLKGGMVRDPRRRTSAM